MTTITTIPATLSVEAAGHVIRLGLWDEFETMLEQAQQFLPNLQALSARLHHCPDGGIPVIMIWAENNPPRGDENAIEVDVEIELAWDRWSIESFPPEVLQHFSMSILRRPDNDAG